jgi:peptidoglycan/LPS O-acetylase OafA/YrhL
MKGGPQRIPSLDGLRAISITMVVFSHLHLLAPQSVAAAWLNFGELGVRVFFVISGFLITGLLLKESEKTGTISLKGFYIRRAFRIFPAALVYLGTIVLLNALGIVTLRPYDALAAATYTMNYHWDRAWHLGHMWSLSVEEQFYLFWPALMLLAGVRRGLLVAAAFVLIAPAVRVGTWVLFPAQREGVGESFQTVFDAIAIGCVLAGAKEWLGQRPRYLALLRSPAFVLLPIVALACNAYKGHTSFDLPFGQTIVNVCIVLCVDRCVRFPDTPFGRFLNSAPLVWVGGLSYSLYLWQQLFMGRDGWTVQQLPWKLIGALGAATASYYLIEQPFLRLRARLQAPAGPRAAAPAPAYAGRVGAEPAREPAPRA